LAALGPGCRAPTLPPGSSDPIIIGAVLPLSGEGLEGDGPYYRDGILLAIREANAAGGPIPGRRVELRVADSEDDPALAAMRARELVEGGAVAILGDAASSGSLAVYEMVTRDARIPQLSCTSTSTLLTTANAGLPVADRFFFRTAPSDRYQAQVVVDAARTEGMCGNRIAILYQDDTYGGPFAMDVQQIITAQLGAMAVVASESFAPSATNFDAQLMAIRAATPNCIVLVTYPPAAGTIVREWAALEPMSTVRWIGTDALFTSTLVDEAGSPATVNGFLGAAPLTMASTPQYNDFAARLQGVYGMPPEPFQSNCYDAAALLMLALAEAGSTDGTAIRDALRQLAAAGGEIIEPAALDLGLSRIFEGRSINYEGASGPVDFDDNGDVVADYVIWRYDAATTMFSSLRTLRPARM
jgi:neutral amino acid transport system substrate-binding protein